MYIYVFRVVLSCLVFFYCDFKMLSISKKKCEQGYVFFIQRQGQIIKDYS